MFSPPPRHSPTHTSSQPLPGPFFLRPIPLPNPLSDELPSHGHLPVERSSHGPVPADFSSHAPKPDEIPIHGTSPVEHSSHGPKLDELSSHDLRVDAAILKLRNILNTANLAISISFYIKFYILRHWKRTQKTKDRKPDAAQAAARTPGPSKPANWDQMARKRGPTGNGTKRQSKGRGAHNYVATRPCNYPLTPSSSFAKNIYT